MDKDAVWRTFDGRKLKLEGVIAINLHTTISIPCILRCMPSNSVIITIDSVLKTDKISMCSIDFISLYTRSASNPFLMRLKFYKHVHTCGLDCAWRSHKLGQAADCCQRERWPSKLPAVIPAILVLWQIVRKPVRDISVVRTAQEQDQLWTLSRVWPEQKTLHDQELEGYIEDTHSSTVQIIEIEYFGNTLTLAGLPTFSPMIFHFLFS